MLPTPARAAAIRLGLTLPMFLLLSSGAHAQSEAQPSWALVPMVGFGVVRDGESWNSAGMEVGLGLEYGAAWRWDGYVGLKGLGVGCSEACWEGGPALATGFSRSLGSRARLGAGVGTVEQHGSWHFVPYGRISFDTAPVRVELRVEVPGDDTGTYLPALVGWPLRPSGR